MMQAVKIIGIGNALVDVLVRIPDDALLAELGLPKGSMQLVDEERARRIAQSMQPFGPQMATGGCAGNTVLALAHLQAHPGFIGRVGSDAVGTFFRVNCLRMGIDAQLTTDDTHSGVAYTLISPDGERTFGTCLGAAARMEAADIRPEMFDGYGLLHVEGYLVQNHALIETVARMAKEAGLRLSIDLASANVVKADLDFFRRLVHDYVDIVFANETESCAFAETSSPEEACRLIAQVADVAVVKLGARGAMARSGDDAARVEARRVAVADTTAAGDFFAAGFLYAHSQGAPLEQSLRCGALLGEHIIQVVGTRLPETAWNELNTKIQDILK